MCRWASATSRATTFAAAISRAAWAAEHVNHTLEGDDHVTQFELLTAAALWAMAELRGAGRGGRGGLGGRYDATSVIDSRVTVLTNVGLEHTRWLGPTVKDIAEEKLAVLRPDTTLVLGEDLAPEALAVAERVAGEQDARIVLADVSSHSAPSRSPTPRWPREARFSGATSRSLARPRRRICVRPGSSRREDAVREAAAATDRARSLAGGEGGPADGARRRAQSRRDASARRSRWASCSGIARWALVLGVLEDKDAASMLRTLLGVCERAWFTAPPSSRALSPAALQSLARQLGFDAVVCDRSEIVQQPWRALAEAQRWARARGENAAVLATGSVYLVGDLLGHLCSADDGSSADGSPESSERRTSRGGGR